MRDLTDPRWLKLKGILFLLVGLLASALIVLERPSLKIATLLALTVWCFCRFYYFAFYVIEHYIDPDTDSPDSGRSPGIFSRKP